MFRPELEAQRRARDTFQFHPQDSAEGLSGVPRTGSDTEKDAEVQKRHDAENSDDGKAKDSRSNKLRDV